MASKFDEKLKEYSQKIVKTIFTDKLYNIIPEL